MVKGIELNVHLFTDMLKKIKNKYKICAFWMCFNVSKYKLKIISILEGNEF